MTSRLARSSLAQLTLVRFREFLRQPEAVFWTFVFPILMAVGLGIAFRARGPEKPKIGVVDTVPAVLQTLQRDTSVMAQRYDIESGTVALRTGRIALLVVPATKGGVEYRYDPARREAFTARLLVDRAVQAAAGRRDVVVATERYVTERGSRYIDFVVPGLLGMNLMGSGIWGIGFSIVESRSKRLLKRLMATPMSRAEFLLSFMLSRLFFLVLEVATLLGFAALAFKVPMRGSLVALTVICVVSALSFAAIGLLVSSRARTLEGVSGLMNFVMVPMWIFSGVFFSSSNFPQVFQPAIQALPLTAVNDALRANMLEGASFAAVGGEIAIVSAWLLLAFVAALRLFRWR